MTRLTYALALAGLAGACSDSHPDPTGTYHIAISAVAHPDNPLQIEYPASGSLVLVGDPRETSAATLGVFDQAAAITMSREVDGGLELEAAFALPIRWDMAVCPATPTLIAPPPTVYALRFEGDHVRGTATETVLCGLRDAPTPNDGRWKFDITIEGDR